MEQVAHDHILERRTSDDINVTSGTIKGATVAYIMMAPTIKFASKGVARGASRGAARALAKGPTRYGAASLGQGDVVVRMHGQGVDSVEGSLSAHGDLAPVCKLFKVRAQYWAFQSNH